MKILHLCSYYVGSKVYKNLFSKISEQRKSIEQTVFIPVRDSEQIGRNKIDLPGVLLLYRKYPNYIVRFSFFLKQVLFWGLFKSCYGERLMNNVIHAHTLYSDGFLAYFLNRKFKIPYTITIRTTDINLFDKILWHWKWLTEKVLKDSKCIVFLSGVQKEIVCRKYQGVINKALVIPNGLDSFWVENASLDKDNVSAQGLKAIFVGEINKNKNVKAAILAFFAVQDGRLRRFVVIGGTYGDYKKVYGSLPASLQPRVDFLGKIYDKEVIRKQIADSRVLIMPSHMETFGLVYLEAISQCTPVVYSQGQGFDGVFPEGHVGFRCNSKDMNTITRAIAKTLQEFPNGLDFSLQAANPVSDFSWDKIAARYLNEVY